jgi:hypothetical protein
LPPAEANRLYNDSDSFGPSVQERLDDVGIYHNDMRDLLQEIRGQSFYDDKYDPEVD